MTTYVQVGARLTEEELRLLDAAVQATGGTRHATIRRVLVEWARAHAAPETQAAAKPGGGAIGEKSY